MCCCSWGVEGEEEAAENCGLLSGQGVNSCRRHGAGQGRKTKSDGPELFPSLCSLNLVKLVGTVTHLLTEESKVT